jgi:Do/DeqQ family serine protease
MKKMLNMVIASIIGSGLTIGIFLLTGINQKTGTLLQTNQDQSMVHNTSFAVKENGVSMPLDFTAVSKEVMNGVVHIKSTRKVKTNGRYYDEESPLGDIFGDQFFRFFYNGPSRGGREKSVPESFEQTGTGSGVIISSNGYIVTNNHVVDQADEIEVTLHNNETYKARVVGTDPSTDIALLQIKENGLPALPIGNSDQVEVGEWVVAVGNPFNLNSTVTAGIVSAKGRNINIIDDKSAIEAFIQTDAAINPGNSGGALVDLNGELIGINTAIASPTGSYTGYGFAIPANIVSKVVEDIMKYGVVQRAYLGVMIRDIDGNFEKEKHLDVSEGVYVDSLTEKSAALEAGIKKGDVIVGVDDVPVLKSADLLEQIGRHRPGDKVSVTVNRSGRSQTFNVELANQKGARKLTSKEDRDVLDMLGASFETLDKKSAEKLGVDGGVIIKDLEPGILKNQTGIQEGFIIIAIDNKKVTSVEDLRKILGNKEGGVMVEGIYENYPGEIFYAFGIPEQN